MDVVTRCHRCVIATACLDLFHIDDLLLWKQQFTHLQSYSEMHVFLILSVVLAVQHLSTRWQDTWRFIGNKVLPDTKSFGQQFYLRQILRVDLMFGFVIQS